ncbi:MAG: hypothetical protein RMN52_00625 [Anaerolineae bacterium]|nr:hypothetical protein [Candidatus Roseilinea sp.]MDW8448481.1 hypothetical protein [Anaerolineae bacterium]
MITRALSSYRRVQSQPHFCATPASFGTVDKCTCLYYSPAAREFSPFVYLGCSWGCRGSDRAPCRDSRKPRRTFSDEELRNLCFDLGVDYDELRGPIKSSKAASLLELLDHRGRIPELIERCARLRDNVAWREIYTLSQAPSPFLGLSFYDVGDADLFFGREKLTATLISHLHFTGKGEGDGIRGGPRFLAVVGASGSGKSSLVRAGVVATLQGKKPLAEGALPAGCRDWLYHIITPTDNPLKALAVSLIPDPGRAIEANRLAEGFLESDHVLDTVARQLAGGAKRRLLLVVDQFEELFTICKDKTLRRAFVDNVLYAASDEHDGPLAALIALRADFYAQCFDFDNLRETLAKRQVTVGPMSADELRRAIEEPARGNGLEFESGLVDLLLRDAGDEPGALPLLSHALLETWKRRRGRKLTLQGYQDAGGVRGAIAKTADSTLAQLTPAQQASARRIFVRLTELGEGTQDTRRRVPLSDLAGSEQEASMVTSVLKTLADARLITTDRDATGSETAEVAHEALIREWPALRAWLEEDRADERIRRQLADDARQWVRLGRDPGALYRGARLAQAREWADKTAGYAALDAQSREFLEASHAAAVREAEEHEARQQRELEAARKVVETERRSAKRARQFVAVLLLVVLVAIGFAVWAIVQTQHAQRQATISQSRALAAQAKYQQELRPDLGLLLSVASLRMADTVEARGSLLDAWQANLRRAFLHAHTGRVSSVAFSPDGRTLALGSEDGVIVLWDVSDRGAARPIGNPLKSHTGSVESVAFSPDGKTLASGSDDNTIVLWDVSERGAARPIGAPLKVHTGSVESVAFSPDGKTLASGSLDLTIVLWDVSERGAARPIGAPLKAHAGSVLSVAFSPDGKTLASGSSDNTIVLWDVSDRGAARPIGAPLKAHAGSVESVAFSPDGKTLASGSSDNTIVLWDVSNRGAARPIGAPLKAHTKSVYGVAFSPDGRTLASGSKDGTIVLWDVSDRGAARPIGEPLKARTGSVYSVAFSPDGRTLASGNWHRTIMLWDVSDRGAARLIGDPLEAHTDWVWSVAFSPDGKTLASAGGRLDGTIVLWDVSERGADRLIGDPLKAHTDWVWSVAFSPDGRTLASGSVDNTIVLWDVSDRGAARPIGEPLKAYTGSVLSVAFSPDGRTLASGSGDNTIVLWDVSERGAARPIGAPFKAHMGPVWSVVFSPDGKTLASGSWDGTIVLWDVSERGATRPIGVPLRTQAGPVRSVAFSPDGKTLASGREYGSIVLWDVSDRGAARPIGDPLKAHTGSVPSVAFSPDGKTLASGSWDGTIVLWDVSDRGAARPIGDPLKAHTDWVSSVAFSPDGKMLASGSEDNTIVLWDVSDRGAARPIGSPLKAHTSHVSSVAFSPDGKTLASVGADWRIRLTRVDPAEWARMACARAGRDLSQAERQTYLADRPDLIVCPEWSQGK